MKSVNPACFFSIQYSRSFHASCADAILFWVFSCSTICFLFCNASALLWRMLQYERPPVMHVAASIAIGIAKADYSNNSNKLNPKMRLISVTIQNPPSEEFSCFGSPICNRTYRYYSFIVEAFLMYVVPCTTRKTRDGKHTYFVRLKRDGAIRIYCNRIGSSQASVPATNVWNEPSRQKHGMPTSITCRVIMEVTEA